MSTRFGVTRRFRIGSPGFDKSRSRYTTSLHGVTPVRRVRGVTAHRAARRKARKHATRGERIALGVQVVGGSNPLAPTNSSSRKGSRESEQFNLSGCAPSTYRACEPSNRKE